MKQRATHQIEKLLDRDPVAETEQAIGKRHDEWNSEDGLCALVHAFGVNQQKRDALGGMDDVHYATKLPDYFRIIGELGFRKVLEIPFRGQKKHHQGAPGDTLYAFFRDNGGLLLTFDTYNGESVNGGKFAYNWRETKPIPAGVRVTSSCSWHTEEQRPNPPFEVYKAAREGNVEAQAQVDELNRWFKANAVMAGDHDCREAIRLNISRLEEFGEFVTPWKHSPHLWLLHYGDYPEDEKPGREASERYRRVNQERFAMLPEDVRAKVLMK